MKIKYVWSLNINFERQVGSRFLKKVYYMYYVSADGKILLSDVKKCPIIMTSHDYNNGTNSHQKHILSRDVMT